MSNFLVSVVIPLYNCEKYIMKAVQSILVQTYKRIELIIIDDGSTDSSLKIVKNIKDKRVRIITKQNGGLAQARNSGISESKGELIGFLDADDYWHPSKIERHLIHFESSSDIGLSFSYSQFCDENNNLIPLYQISMINNIKAKDIFFKNPVGNGSTFLIKRQLAHEISGLRNLKLSGIHLFNPDLSQSEDIECWLRITLGTNWKIEGIPYILTYYRINNFGLSSNLVKQYDSWDTTVKILKNKYPEFIKNNYSKAKSYYLRFLARRAYSSRRIKTSFGFFVKSLKEYPLIIIEDPMRTSTTLLAILFSLIMPDILVRKLEAIAMNATSRCQSLRIKLRQMDYQYKVLRSKV